MVPQKKHKATVSERELSEVDIVIVDAFSLLFRAFHSFPISLTTPDGQLTNAVYGFTRLLLDMLKRTKPEYLIVATDMGRPTFRHQAYTQYKANREEAPHELTSQIGMMKEIVAALNIPMLGVEGYEADDVIGTLSHRIDTEHSDLVAGIFTGDRDAFQLIRRNIYVLMPDRLNKGDILVIDAESVIERLSVSPEQVVDYKALCGDASDNIPGVRGIGPKSAAQLLAKFGTLERLYGAIALAGGGDAEAVLPGLSETERGALLLEARALSAGTLKKLSESIEDAWTSQKLARIDQDVPFEFELEQARLCDYDKATAIALFDRLGFSSLKKSLPNDSFERQVEDAIQTSLFG